MACAASLRGGEIGCSKALHSSLQMLREQQVPML
jgi:hypothetical protein